VSVTNEKFNALSDRFNTLLEAIEDKVEPLDEMTNPEGMKKGVLVQLKWLKGDIEGMMDRASKIQLREFSVDPLKAVYYSLMAARGLLSEVDAVITGMGRDPTMAGVASQQNVIHLRKQIKKFAPQYAK